MKILEIMNPVLSLFHWNTTNNDIGLNIISVTETYGDFILDSTDISSGLEFNRENISKDHARNLDSN